MSKKNIKGIVVTANIIQWYDFIIFAFLAPQIAKNFFEGNSYLGTFKTLAVFAIAYIARPIGAIFLGWAGDKFGVASAIRTSMFLVVLPSCLMTIMPTASMIGVLSPVLLLIIRLIQSFGMGAEYPLSAKYAYVASDSNKKIFNSGLSAISAMLGMLAASGVIVVLNSLLSNQQMLEWGWRIAFFLCVPFSLYIFKIRMDAINTQQVKIIKINSQDSRIIPVENDKQFSFTARLIMGTLIIGMAEAIFYTVSVYMPSYLIQIVHISGGIAQKQGTIATLCLILIIIPCCYLAQKKGIYKLMVTGALFFLFISLPLYWWISEEKNIWLNALPYTFLVVGTVCFGVCNMPFLNRIFSGFNKASMGICLSYTAGVGLLSAPSILLASYLLKETGNPLIPGTLVSIYALILFALLIACRPLLAKNKI